MTKYQLIRNINSGNNPQQMHKSSRRSVPLLLAVFLGVLIYVTAIMMKIANDIHKNNIGDNGAGAKVMLNNFVETTDRNVPTKEIDGTPPPIERKASSQEIVFSSHQSLGRYSRPKRVKNIVHKQKRSNKSNQHQQKQLPSSTIINQLINRANRIEVPDEKRRIAFVHIGKSGGSTISLLLRNGCMTSVDGVPCALGCCVLAVGRAVGKVVGTEVGLFVTGCNVGDDVSVLARDAKSGPNRWMKIPGQHEETIASKRIEFYLHTPHAESGMMAEYYSRVSTVVVVARDPLERFISAFLCRHPRNIDATRARNTRVRKQYEAKGLEAPAWAKPIYGSGNVTADQIHRESFTGCYPNVEELAKCAAPGSSAPEAKKIHKATISWVKRGTHQMKITLNCREVCQDIMLGKNDAYIHHVRWNYEQFLKDLPSDTEVMVIRTKRLWSDWIDINNLLGSKRDVDVPDKESEGGVVNARGSLPIKNNLSATGQVIICQFLKNDIKIYIDLMNRAVNLSDDDVRGALEGVQKSCPSVLRELVAQR